MAKVNYLRRIRSSGASALTSLHCRFCYRLGKRDTAFFGVGPNGACIWGHRDKDQAFQKAIWNVAKKHLREEHGFELVSNGHVDSYKMQRIIQ